MQIGRGKSKRHQKLTIYNTTISARYENNLKTPVVPGDKWSEVRILSFRPVISTG